MATLFATGFAYADFTVIYADGTTICAHTNSEGEWVSSSPGACFRISPADPVEVADRYARSRADRQVDEASAPGRSRGEQVYSDDNPDDPIQYCWVNYDCGKFTIRIRFRCGDDTPPIPERCAQALEGPADHRVNIDDYVEWGDYGFTPTDEDCDGKLDGSECEDAESRQARGNLVESDGSDTDGDQEKSWPWTGSSCGQGDEVTHCFCDLQGPDDTHRHGDGCDAEEVEEDAEEDPEDDAGRRTASERVPAERTRRRR